MPSRRGQLAEARSSTGRRVTDVLVRGKGSLLLGHELQVSKLSVATIKKRIRVARDDGLMPMWTTDNPDVQVEHRCLGHDPANERWLGPHGQ